MITVKQFLHMNGGLGENSYANNSRLQRKVIFMTMPIIEEAMIQLYNHMLTNKTISIADFGCGSGPNTLLLVTELVKIIDEQSRKLGSDLPEFQIHLNDLPMNDFNSMFKFLIPCFQEKLMQDIGHRLQRCFITGVPGTFYGRLFPARSLHFAHSSYSLMWLSKVPQGVEMNKDNIYMAGTSPECVIKAYYEQFQKDFMAFMKYRSTELVAGGNMVLTLLGRRNGDASSRDGCYIWELMAMAIKQMVSEGLIEEDKLHSFHIPMYTPSPSEVKLLVEKEGSFTINHLESSEIKWSDCGSEFHLPSSVDDDGYNVAKCMRSVAEALLVQHFGVLVIDQLFDKYTKILSHCMSREEQMFISVTISMTRGARE